MKSFRKDLGPDVSQISEDDIQEYITSETEYNENNNIINEITYTPDGSIEQRYKYKYNSEGKLQEELLYYEDGEIADRKKYEYNDKGYLLKELIYYQDKTFDTIQYNYNADMNLIEKTTVNSDGETDEKEIFEYSNGKVILNAIFDGEKNKFYETTFKYNEDGKVTELKEWDSETNKKTKSVSTYDDNGVLIKQIRYANDSLIAKMTFTLDENNRVKQVEDEDVNHRNTIDIIHDANGNIIEETEFNFHNEMNHKINRTFNENNDVLESRVFMDPHSGNVVQNYVIRHEYEYR